MNKNYDSNDFCNRTINNVLNRIGYTLKKVLKTKPLKKIPETDAIFENIKKQHDRVKKEPRILRISIDVKAKVKIGNLSRKGYSRAINTPKADDHDHHWTDVLVPFGLHEEYVYNFWKIIGNT